VGVEYAEGFTTQRQLATTRISNLL
jgi:hypothetical protein